MGLFEETLGELTRRGQKVLPGAIAFKLYDTFGFPLDLIEVLCREKGLTVDHAGFDEGMARQREQSAGTRATRDGERDVVAKRVDEAGVTSRFTGYERLEDVTETTFLADLEGKSVDRLAKGQRGFACFAATPCYAEGGGQVGDRGWIRGKDFEAAILDTFKSGRGLPVHQVEVRRGDFVRSGAVTVVVDAERRLRTAANHTATHLLHAALRTVLGDRVRQAGSLVEPDKLRFDFTYPKALTPEERDRIEQLVNDQVRANRAVEKTEMTYDEAIRAGALAFFDEKYGDRVRVVRVAGAEAPFSVELCGGTHLDRLADVAVFRIVSESSVASGVRRIEAITGFGAIDWLLERDRQLGGVERALKAAGAQAVVQVEKLEKELQAARKEIESLRVKAVQGGGGGTALHDRKRDVGAFRLVAEVVADVDAKALRTLVDQVRDKLGERAVVLLGTTVGGKAMVCLGLSKDLVDRLDAGKLVQSVAADLGGTGGGKKDFAQAGGPAPEKLGDAFTRFAERLAQS
jgi:alanyl-tRNA synthetase